jgi:hypothetical protein
MIIKLNNKEYDINKKYNWGNTVDKLIIMQNNLNLLKKHTYPIHIKNDDGLNGFHIAAKIDNIEILRYLIKTYKKYIYDINTSNNYSFIDYLSIDNIIKLLGEFNNLNWDILFQSNIIESNNRNITINNILKNIDYKNLKELIKLYKIKFNKNQPLIYILFNKNLNDKQKIEIFDNFTLDKLNTYNSYNEGLLLMSILENKKELFNYFIEKKLNVENTSNLYINLLFVSIEKDYNSKKIIYTQKILESIKNKNFIYNTDKYNNNILHLILLLIKNKKYVFDKLIKLVFQYATNELLNEYNIYKNTPYNYINDLLNEKKINLDLIKEYIINKNINKDIFIDNKDLIKILNVINDINVELINYDKNKSLCTFFESRIFDTIIYILLFLKKYPDFTIPINTDSLEGIQWMIKYNTLNNEGYIDKNLNNLINDIKSKKKYKYIIVYLIIDFSNSSHANLLIYDLNKMIIERFEPYGSAFKEQDINVDIFIKNKLTKDTGFIYYSPDIYMPKYAFQFISDDNINNKSGDKGFCLGWCFWYLESKLINQNIDSKTLIKKLKKKLILNKKPIKDYIRDYSNILTLKESEYLENNNIKINNLFELSHNDIDNIIMLYKNKIIKYLQ